MWTTNFLPPPPPVMNQWFLLSHCYVNIIITIPYIFPRHWGANSWVVKLPLCRNKVFAGKSLCIFYILALLLLLLLPCDKCQAGMSYYYALQEIIMMKSACLRLFSKLIESVWFCGWFSMLTVAPTSTCCYWWHLFSATTTN